VIQYVSQLAHALTYIYSQGISQCYIAPETIFIGYHGEALLAGFILRLFQISQTVEQHSSSIPVPLCYMPPEWVLDMSGRSLDKFGDQYALAAVVYEWLYGQPLFQGAKPIDLVLQIIQAPPPSLHEKVSTLPAAVDQVIGKALAKKREERFATVQAFSDALDKGASNRLARPDRPSYCLHGR
jgi:serine/threonine protein kinase